MALQIISKKVLIVLLTVVFITLSFSNIFSATSKRSQVQGKSPSADQYRAYYVSELDVKTLKADRLRNYAINRIVKLLKEKNSKATTFQLLIRLADLYAEKSHFLKSKEIIKYEKELEKFLKKGSKGKAPSLKAHQSRGYLFKSINIYRKMARDYYRHPEVDRVLFSLSFLLTIVNDSSSKDYLVRLIKRHPRSKFIPDAYLALGEYYFAKNDMNRAISYYKAVMRYKKAKAYGFAVYKLGWCYFNKKINSKHQAQYNYAKALAAFKLVVHSKKVNLWEEALNDLVLVYAENEKVEDAWKYFQKIGKKQHFRKMLILLAGLYKEYGKSTKAITLYNRLIKEFPSHPDNYLFVRDILEIHKAKRSYSSVIPLIGYLQRNFNQDSNWQKANSANKSLNQKYQKFLESTLKEWATRFHSMGQRKGISKNEKSKNLTRAAYCYQNYLNNFGKNKDAYQLRFNYAEIQYEFKNYQLAAFHYLQVAKQNTKGKLFMTSAEGAIQSYLAEINKQKIKAPKSGQQAVALPRIIASFIEAGDFFIKEVKRGQKVIELKARIAQIYHDYSHYNETLKRLLALSREHYSTPEGIAAAKMSISIHYKQKNWSEVNKWARRYLKERVSRNKKLKTALIASVKESMFKWAEELEKQKKYLLAAKKFVAYQNEFPKDEYAANALLRGALSYQRGMDMQKSISILRVLDKKYRTHKNNVIVVAKLAQFYESIIEMPRAAKFYDTLAKRYKKNKKAARSLLNAAIIYQGLDRHHKAIDCYERYFDNYAKKSEKSEIASTIVELAVPKRMYTLSKKYYKFIIANGKKDEQLFAEIKLGQLLIKTKQKTKGKNRIAKASAQFFKLSESQRNKMIKTRGEIAEMMFKKASKDLNRFLKVSLRNAKTLNKNLSRKQNLLTSLNKQFSDIIKLHDAKWGVASLYQLGHISQHMAVSLFKSAVPTNLSEKDKFAFRSELEKYAFPLEKEAVKFFELAWQKAIELGVYSEYTHQIYNGLSKLDPIKYPVSDYIKEHDSFTINELTPTKHVEQFILN